MPQRIPKSKKRVTPQTAFINSEANQVKIDNKNHPINFSFKYLTEDDIFHINRDEGSYFQHIIHRLQCLCTKTFMELMADRSPALRFHQIDWDDPRVSRDGFGLPIENDLYDEAYQFSTSSNEYGRIVGFFTDQLTFNIVWFDKEHNLYPDNA